MGTKAHPVTIFIGYDPAQAVACHVLRESIIQRASSPVSVRFVNLHINRPFDPLQSTPFTYTRFLVPWLTGYQGRALFMDCDMLVLEDIIPLLDTNLDGFALACVKHSHAPKTKIKMGDKIQTAYPRKNWSSLMLLNCSELGLWSKEYVEKAPAKALHRFEGIDDNLIAGIDPMWNVLDSWTEGTKNLHFTSGGPWLPGCESQPSSEVWWTHAELLGFGPRLGLIERWVDRCRDLREAQGF